MQRQAVLRAAVCFGLLVVGAGCVTESVSGDTHKYTYSGWVPVLWFLISIGAAGIGFLMLKSENNKSRGVWCIIGGLVVLVLIAPSTLTGKVLVSPDDVSINTSMFWPTAKPTVLKFDEMKSFGIETREERGRRGRRKQVQYMVFEMDNGKKHSFGMSSELMKKARPAIESAAAKK